MSSLNLWTFPRTCRGGTSGLPEDERHFAEYLATPLAMPVLAVGGALDNGELIAVMAREVAHDVRARIAPGGGHWTPEEAPEFLVEQLLSFVAEARP